MPINSPDVFNSIGEAVIVGGGGSGATTFLELTDTPTSYVDQGGKAAVVSGTGLQFGYLPGTRVGGAVHDPATTQTTNLNALVWTPIANMTMTWTASAATQIVCLHTSFQVNSSVTEVRAGLSTDPSTFTDIGGTNRIAGLYANSGFQPFMFMWQLTGLVAGNSYSVTPFLNPGKSATNYVGGSYQAGFLYAMHP